MGRRRCRWEGGRMEGRRETLIKEREQRRVKNIKKRVNVCSNSVMKFVAFL